MITRSLKLAVPALAAGSLMAFGAPVGAAEYFAGKTITVQVPSGSGGTYMAYCQMVQRNLANYIPGKPKTIIQNMSGAGGAKSASYMYNVAPKDGFKIAMMINGRRQLTCMCLATDGMTIEPPPNRKIVKDLVFETD